MPWHPCSAASSSFVRAAYAQRGRQKTKLKLPSLAEEPQKERAAVQKDTAKNKASSVPPTSSPAVPKNAKPVSSMSIEAALATSNAPQHDSKGAATVILYFAVLRAYNMCKKVDLQEVSAVTVIPW